MPIPLTASDVLDREFLEIRAKLLEIGAALDRLDRAEGSVAGDLRLERFQQALAILCQAEPDRAERIQHVFSLPYDEDWQDRFGLGR